MHRPHLLILTLLLAAWGSAAPAPGQDAAALIAEARRERDEVAPEKIHALAALRDVQATQGLVDLYDQMGSIYMRREVLRALISLLDASDLAPLALEKLGQVAGTTPEPELLETALDGIAKAGESGLPFLVAVVESPAADLAREAAMRRHVALNREGDAGWYRELYERGWAEEKKSKKGKEEVARPRVLPAVREMAFGALAPRLQASELAEAALRKAKDRQAPPLHVIRQQALVELERREPKKALSAASKVYKDVTEWPENRALAARIMVAQKGTRCASQFLADASKATTPARLREELADLLAAMDDAGARRKLLRGLGKVEPDDLRFRLRALQGVVDEDLVEELCELLENKDPALRILAARCLAERFDLEALPILKAMALAPESDAEATVVIDAVATLGETSPEWAARLRELAGSENPALRNSALGHLTRLEGPGARADLVAALAHEDWTTRRVALTGLEALRDREALAAIIARMPAEQGRLRREFADTLWRLSAKPFKNSAETWQRWWDDEGAAFEIPSPEAVATAEVEREERRLKQISFVQGSHLKEEEEDLPTFFGVRIQSRSVLFILDVSGSMAEAICGDMEGELGDVRLAAALRELEVCIDGLEESSHFNILAFSSDVFLWSDEGMQQVGEGSREEVKEWLGRLGAGGGTNLHGALERGFEAVDVDTIYLLSDGEPSTGAVVDPLTIRRLVETWNEHRGVVIHAVAVGSRLKLLKWLAEDSGGDYVQIW